MSRTTHIEEVVERNVEWKTIGHESDHVGENVLQDKESLE